jgi:diketogulonate reductase-like aldo/keto reductase
MSSSSAIPRIPLSSGYSIPLVGFGTWRSSPQQVRIAVRTAILNGYTHIDCARLYGNEKEVGEGIADALAQSPHLTRSDLFLTSKLWNDQHSAESCHEAVERCLKDLQTVYLDLLLIHWPVSWHTNTREDAQIPLIDTWKAMELLVKQGKVRSIGVSNFNSQELTQMIQDFRIEIFPAVNQIELHPYWNQAQLRDQMKQISSQVREIQAARGVESVYELLVEAYCPLGNLQRKEGESAWNESPMKHPVIIELSEKYGLSVAQIILQWHYQHHWVFLPKSVTEERIKENIKLNLVQLTQEEMNRIDAIGEEKRIRFVNPEFRDGGKKKLFED